MALIKCPECGKEMSDKAKSCPNCGYIEKSNRTTIFSVIKNNPFITGIIVIIFIIIACVIGYNIHQESLLETVRETNNKIDEIDREYYYKYGI